MDQTELLWGLLEANQLDAVKKLNPERVDFKSLDGTYGITLLIQCANMALNESKKVKVEQVLDCIEWLISCGASPWQKCPLETEENWCFSLKEGTEEEEEGPCYSDHTAISYARSWVKQLSGKPEWAEEFAGIGRVLESFATAIPQQKAARVPIHETVVELWEKQLAAKASHDLTFKTADGEVTAHAQMLKDASSVISAMLASPMKEGHAQAIWVKDASSSAVSLFLERPAKHRVCI